MDDRTEQDDDVAPQIVRELREICRTFPDAYEERAWVGRRWRIRTWTFAHALTIVDGWPPGYARAAANDGPARVLMFRSSEPELGMLRRGGYPFFAPPWREDEVGMILDADVDWSEIAELVTESYCLLAPKRLAEDVRRRTGGTD